MRYEIPGYKTLTIENVVMDFNGTIAVDGVIKEAVKQRIIRLAEYYRVYVLTSTRRGPQQGSWRICPLRWRSATPIMPESANAGLSKVWAEISVPVLATETTTCSSTMNTPRPAAAGAAAKAAADGNRFGWIAGFNRVDAAV